MSLDENKLHDLPAGIYQHYKGPLYLVLGYGHDANAGDLVHRNDISLREQDFTELGYREVVVYVGLQLNEAHRGPRLAVRTVSDFLADINPRSGRVCPGGATCDDDPCRPRFRYLGPSYEPSTVKEE